MTETSRPEPVSRLTTEHYDRFEYHLHSKLVEFHVSTTMRSLQAAVAAALAEVEALGIDPNELPVTYRGAGRGTGSGVVAYEVERDEPGPVTPPADEHGFVAILAYLPRDWSRQLATAITRAAVDTGRVSDVLALVDGWVLAATSD